MPGRRQQTPARRRPHADSRRRHANAGTQTAGRRGGRPTARIASVPDHPAAPHAPPTPRQRPARPSGPASDHLAVVLASIRNRVPVDDREARSVEQALEALPLLGRPFDRDAGPVHVTGSGILARPDEILLLRHKLLGIWVQPGGHVDGGEAPWDAARRETEEETGLRVRLTPDGTGAGGTAPGDLGRGGAPPLVHIDVHPAAHGHTHIDLRYGLVPAGDHTPRPPAGESQSVAWYALDEAIVLADPGLRGLLVHLRLTAGDRD